MGSGSCVSFAGASLVTDQCLESSRCLFDKYLWMCTCQEGSGMRVGREKAAYLQPLGQHCPPEHCRWQGVPLPPAHREDRPRPAPLPSVAVQQPPWVPAETATSSRQEPSAWQPSPGSPQRLLGAIAGPMGPLPHLRGLAVPPERDAGQRGVRVQDLRSPVSDSP